MRISHGLQGYLALHDGTKERLQYGIFWSWVVLYFLSLLLSSGLSWWVTIIRNLLILISFNCWALHVILLKTLPNCWAYGHSILFTLRFKKVASWIESISSYLHGWLPTVIKPDSTWLEMIILLDEAENDMKNYAVQGGIICG